MTKKVKVTMELTPKELMRLADYLNDPHEIPDEKPAKKEKTVEEETVEEEKEPAITKAQLRGLGVKITKAGKQAELKKAFEKFGAKKLGEVKEEDYPDLYKEMEEIDA